MKLTKNDLIICQTLLLLRYGPPKRKTKKIYLSDEEYVEGNYTRKHIIKLKPVRERFPNACLEHRRKHLKCALNCPLRIKQLLKNDNFD